MTFPSPRILARLGDSPEIIELHRATNGLAITADVLRSYTRDLSDGWTFWIATATPDRECISDRPNPAGYTYNRGKGFKVSRVELDKVGGPPVFSL